ncbi:MAG: maltose alpha-D-glucosyltransferase [Hyphomicrobiales bacterium]|nr:maltose alpha-D-glucosyltransferase [Hyphomicrobiales bacterium]
MIDRSDKQWYRDAIFYQVHVKSFFDANNDGIGDFEGLTRQLDYIKALGVTALWVMPFYPSPLRDDGYDIAEYRGINPNYGTMRDFRRFVRHAHERELRVVTELVINHTSDQHPWFQRARRAKPGSHTRDFYVWSDTDKKYAGTRIIFLDTEPSNWSWDSEAQAYYWHRFYSHQPDLNFDNPRVIEAVLDTMRFWLDMGVDGLRLDAIPYLIEREGTSCENLVETHAVIKKIRAAIDAEYPDRMLLAEANQWPEDAALYFGEGDECHMAFHFPLMPRIYMAVAQEDRHPITDIMRQTPEIPDNCQWAIFLRNHDELTLEMVTDRERDYLWTFFAAERRARINLGIRRRLAPLLDNDRRKIELLNSLLLSMPGTPVLYYGDEIGMGDNIYLGDRDGVRTPMQWSPDRNGGFSRSDPARLFLPAIQDPIYGFDAVNVEAQLRSPSSLLNWLRRLMAVRRNHPAFGRGALRFLYPANRKVLAFLREAEEERLLCVVNLSRGPQAVELDLSALNGSVPIELTGGSSFPRIGELPYLLTLPAYGFYWFQISAASEAAERFASRQSPELFTLVLGGPPDSLLKGRERVAFEANALPSFLASRRWFAGGDKRITSSQVRDFAVLKNRRGEDTFLLALVEVVFGQGNDHIYSLPLAIDEQHEDEAFLPDVVAKVRRGSRVGLLYAAEVAPEFGLAAVTAMERGTDLPSSNGGVVRFTGSSALATMGDIDADQVKRLGADQSNSSIVFGESMILKLYRRLQPGIHPELEIARFLSEVAHFENTPALLGTIEHIAADGTRTALGILQRYVRNQGDAWRLSVEALKRELDTLTLVPEGETPPLTEVFATYRKYAKILGKRTADLHRALATPTSDSAFSIEALTDDDMRASIANSREIAGRAYAAVESRLARPDSDSAREILEMFIRRREECLGLLDRLGTAPDNAVKMRIHGDFHLGQVLIAQNDMIIVDFEGEPTRPASERRVKSSPLRDVAGMLRSFSYVAETVTRDISQRLTERASRVGAVAAEWQRLANYAFLSAYEGTLRGSSISIGDRNARRRLLRFYILSKALYEVDYEANHRPDWVETPVRGVLAMLDEDAGGP